MQECGIALWILAAVSWLPARADEVAVPEPNDATTLDRIVVIGRHDNLVGTATTASEGRLSRTEIERRPRLRPGDLVEFVPGVAATQHSGSGKANQYFLRGFNLDHGTDFAQFVEGMPVNMRTHGHGHGYSDLNFLIPEMVDSLTYRKGPYYADVGDFSSAGAVRYQLLDGVEEGLLQVEAGSEGYARFVGVDSSAQHGATLTWGIEAQQYDGPWADINEDVDKRNLMLRLSAPVGRGVGQALAMYYDSTWNSPDQIPARAVDRGLISEFGSIDTTLGGDSSRKALSGGWRGHIVGGEFSASAYFLEYDLSLWSNFTYFLEDMEQGDQFLQFDSRKVSGFEARQVWQGVRWQVRTGLEGRRDDIGRVGLSHAAARKVIRPVRDDTVDERSLGMWLDGEWTFNENLRARIGVRQDVYDFEVHALQPQNSGNADDALTSLKGSLAWRLGHPLEVYASWGQGLHSNDARGTTISIDPLTGAPADPVTPLVRSEGSELGLRWFQQGRLSATAALWQLDLDSELLFVGDAGNTEATRPSERSGVELTMYWLANPLAQLELEAAYTRARFSDADPTGNHIPGAVPLVVSLGWTAEWDDGWHSSLRLRKLGPYPLIEDDSVRSEGSTLVNLAVGKRWKQWGVELDVLNLLDSDDHDIDYFYASRLPGEPAGGVDDLHFHVSEPRTLRVRLTRTF